MNLFTKKQRQIIRNDSTTQRNFSYTKDRVSLSFQLRTDAKKDLKDFLELLELAVKEVTDEIAK